MATYELSNIRHGAARATDFWAGARHALSRKYAAWKAYHITLAELQALSDRELADLGMHRSELGAIASEAAEQKSV